MKSLKKWLKERWLKNRGWTKSWYPFQMDDPFFSRRTCYAVWHHPCLLSVGGLDWALEIERRLAEAMVIE